MKILDNYQGVVLAAGFGKRLRPLTSLIPKPLAPFIGIPSLYLSFYRFQMSGIQNILMNGHYLAESLKKSVESYPYKIDFQFSHEKSILGTGGAFFQLCKFQKEKKDFVILNGDVISNVSLPKLVRAHEKYNASATMAVLPSVHKNETSIWCLEDQVIAIGGEKPHKHATAHGFACAHILSNNFLHKIEPRPESIITYYQNALKNKETIAASIQDLFWYDLGTPGNYLESQIQFLKMFGSLLNCDSKTDPLGVFDLLKASGVHVEYIADGQNKQANNIQGPILYSKNIEWGKNLNIGPNVIAIGKGEINDKTCLEDCLLFGKFKTKPETKRVQTLFYDDLEMNLT